ncbi:uncharacterized protein PF3D7_1120000-like [Mytilus edulis]|uniref:uncharacterized protein PF3D7_1120000-like n=1 Tax=Mytilus edulis TaxID=6550 RepID=UPI0039F044ED
MSRQYYSPILIFLLMNYSCKCQDLEKFVAPILNQQMAPLIAIVDTTNISSHIVRSIEKPLRDMINATIECKVNEKLKEDIVSSKILGNVSNKFDSLQQKMDEHMGDKRKQLTEVNQDIATLRKEMEERIKQDIVSLRKETEEKITREIRDNLKILTRNLSTEKKDLDEKVKTLTNHVDNMQSYLKATIVSVDSNVSNVAGQLKNHLSSLEMIRSNLQELTVNTSTIQTAIGNIKTTADINNGRLSAQVSNLENLKATVNDINLRVALSACVSPGYTAVTSSAIKFQNIITSKGITNQHLTSFNSSGVFVCKVPGLYHISVVIMSYTQDAQFKISKHDIELMRGYTNNYYTENGRYTYWQSNAAIVVTELQKGDRIDIKPSYKEMYLYGNNYSCLTIVKVK